MQAHNSILEADYFTQFPARYNHFLLQWRKKQLGYTNLVLAQVTGYSKVTIRQVFTGNATSKYVFTVAQLLGLDWAMVHDLTLPEDRYKKAVLSGRMRGPQLIALQGGSSNSR